MKLIPLFIAITISLTTMAQSSKDTDFYLLVGTYTNEQKTNGIHVYTFNAQTGDFQEKSKNDRHQERIFPGCQQGQEECICCK